MNWNKCLYILIYTVKEIVMFYIYSYLQFFITKSYKYPLKVPSKNVSDLHSLLLKSGPTHSNLLAMINSLGIN